MQVLTSNDSLMKILLILFPKIEKKKFFEGENDSLPKALKGNLNVESDNAH